MTTKKPPPPFEVPPPAEAAERWAGILQAWGFAWAGTILGQDPVLARSMGELTCCLHALIELGQRHDKELHEIYLQKRREPLPFGATPPAYAFTAVRDLTGEERDRVRECVTWCQRAREDGEPEDYAEARLAEARRRWPDVARLIGFA